MHQARAALGLVRLASPRAVLPTQDHAEAVGDDKDSGLKLLDGGEKGSMFRGRSGLREM